VNDLLGLARQDEIGKWVFELVLKKATQRTRPPRLIGALAQEIVEHLVVQTQRDVRGLETRGERVHAQLQNGFEVAVGQPPKDDRLVEAVEELGAERPLRLRKEFFLQDIETRLGRFLGEAERLPFAGEIEAEVRRADDQRVAEIDDASITPPEGASYGGGVFSVNGRLAQVLKIENFIDSGDAGEIFRLYKIPSASIMLEKSHGGGKI